MPDPYETLQVSRKAEIEVIEAAYRQLARKYHPDKNASSGSTKRMQEINAAYEILKDPMKRREYDRANPVPSGYIRYQSEESKLWADPSDAEAESGWAHSYMKRRSNPAPIPRPDFWQRNWGCILYIIVCIFVLYEILVAVGGKL